MRIRMTWFGVIGAPALAGVIFLTSGCTQSQTPSGETAARTTGTPAASDAVETDESNDPAPSEGPEVETVAVTPVAETTAIDDAPEVREVAKPVVGEYAANVPAVLLSAEHAKLCTVNVGDAFPAIDLPKLGGGNASVKSLAGAKATIVAFWTDDRWMSKTALHDLVRAAGDGVSIVGVAVGVKQDAAEKTLADSGVKFTQLVDEQGSAFAQVGTGALPRLYVLDGEGRVAWFDIEYSEATRRELKQTLAALTE
jgi:peroxiredoxin